MTLRALLASVVLAMAAFPAGASAAATADRVIDEVSAPMDVGIDGSVVAYTRRVGTRGVQVVIRDGERPVVRLAAGGGESPVGVGRDGTGARVVVYLRCAERCDVVAYSPAAGRARVVDRAVFVEAPSDAGCALGNDFLEQIIARVPCRIVLADLSGERLLAPRISIDKRVATVMQAKVRGGKITGRLPLAGVAVEVRDSEEKLVATLTTDAAGKVALPEADGDGLALSAATTPRSYAYDSGT